ncbi:integrase, catalytic region, zinc finger, CCHC-type containing protein [Tanacetum coccineum]
MSSNSDDIQAVGFDTRPPMLDKTDYDSWSQRIRLYCRGKENGIYILQSIDHGPFKLGTTRDTLGTTPEGSVLLGPERPRTYDDLNDNDKKLFDADVRATNIVFQGLPKDIYKIINYNIEAKAIWDNVKMLLAGSKLTKEDRESQLYDEFERFKMLSGENINEYYVRFHKLVNDIRNIRMTMPNIQLNSKFVNNMSPEWDRFVTSTQRNFARGASAVGNGGAQNRAGNANAGQGKPIKCYNCNGLGHIAQNCTQPKRLQNSDFFKDKMLLMQAQENGAVLDEEELLFLAGEQTNTFDADVDDQPVRDLAQNDDNIFQADECDAFDSDVDDEPTAQSIFMANLSSTRPANLQAGPSNASILSEVHDLENTIDHYDDNQDEHETHNEVQHKHVIDSNGAEMGNSNVIPYEQYLTINDVSVEPSCASSVLNDAYVLHDNNAYIPHDPLVTELNIYKQQVAMYEQRAKFDLKLHEQKMDEQMSLLIQDHNKKEENLKKELHSVKLQLNLPIKSNKIIEETVTALKHVSLVKEVRTMKGVFENMEAEVDQNVFDKKCGEIERKNLLIINENLIAKCIPEDVFYTVSDSALTASRFHDLSNAYNDFSKLEIDHLNLQLKHQHLKENIENFKYKSSKDVPEFDAFFELGKRDDQIQGHKNTISLQEQLEHFKAENEKVKQHYQESFKSIKITCVKTIERTTSLQTEIENLKTQLKGKMPCITSNVESPKVSVFEKYAIEVESIPPSQRNNRDVHHHYLNRLRDTLDTLYEIVEETKSKRPSDHSLDYACVYTKQSQELLENVSSSCPKARNKRDKVIATTPLTRKKHVTFADPLETSGNNTTNHVKNPTVQKTNVPIIHSTRVINATKARRSQSKSNKMNDKTLPANSVPKKKVKDHHKKNKSKLSKKNRVDSSTSVRRTVFNTNSNSLCKTCNECIISFNHDKCVENSLKSSKPPQIFPLGAQCPLTRNTKPKVVPVKQWKPTGRLIPLGGQCPLVRPTALNRNTMPADPLGNNTHVKHNLVCSTTIGDLFFQTLHCRLCSNAGRTDRPLVFGLRLLKTYD